MDKILIGLLIVFVLLGIGGLAGSKTTADIAIGSGADARGQADLAVAEAEARALDAQTQADAEAARIANENTERTNEILRAQRAAAWKTFYGIIGWVGAFGASITIIALAFSTGSYAVIMGTVVLPFKRFVQPQQSQKGDITATYFPALGQGTLNNAFSPNTTVVLEAGKSPQLLEGDPDIGVAGAGAKGLAVSSQGGHVNFDGESFLDALSSGVVNRRRLVDSRKNPGEDD